MKQEALKKMYQLLLTEPHAPTVCAKLEVIAREALAQTQEPDVQETLHWHAFNYRQAHTAQAHEMWEKLEQFVESKIKAPQRTWVGLTDEDRKQITRKANYHWEMTTGEYAERIGELTEAKLKEKNT